MFVQSLCYIGISNAIICLKNRSGQKYVVLKETSFKNIVYLKRFIAIILSSVRRLDRQELVHQEGAVRQTVENSNELSGVDNFILSQGINFVEKTRIESSIGYVQMNDG